MAKKIELWKDIEGFEGLYQVSNTGRVKSLARSIIMSNGRSRKLKTKILKLDNSSNNGYYMVTLCVDYVKKVDTVHRLIAKTFLPNPDNLEQVNHVDGNKGNNNLDNLEWCTHKYNMKHASLTGLFPSRQGEKAGRAKLTEEGVLKCRELYSTGDYSSRELGELYGVSTSSMYQALTKQTWKHI